MAGALVPFALIGLPLAAAEASAREVESLADIGLASRLAWALTHPALYVWRTLAPMALTTLDALPRVARPDWARAGLAVVGLGRGHRGDLARLWSWRGGGRGVGSLPGAARAGRRPVAVGTAGHRRPLHLRPGDGAVDRAWRLAVSALARAPQRARARRDAGAGRRPRRVGAGRSTAHWRDSLTLWTRAVTLDADNDVARYNLALALIDAGRRDEAIVAARAAGGAGARPRSGPDPPGRPARRPRAAGGRRRGQRRPARGRGRRPIRGVIERDPSAGPGAAEPRHGAGPARSRRGAPLPTWRREARLHRPIRQSPARWPSRGPRRAARRRPSLCCSGCAGAPRRPVPGA